MAGLDLDGLFNEDANPKPERKNMLDGTLSLADLGLEDVDEQSPKVKRNIPILDDPIDDDEDLYEGMGTEEGVISYLEDPENDEDYNPSEGVMSQEELERIMTSTISVNDQEDLEPEPDQPRVKKVKEKKYKAAPEAPIRNEGKGLNIPQKFMGWFKFHFTLTNAILIVILILGMTIAILRATAAEKAVSNMSSPVANQSAYLDNIGEQSAVILSSTGNEMKYVGWQVKSNSIYFYYQSAGERFFAPYDGLKNEVGDLKMTLSIAEVKRGVISSVEEEKSFSQKDKEWKKAEEIIQSISGQGSADKTVLFSPKAIRVLEKYKGTADLKVVTVKGSGSTIKIEFSKAGLLNAYGRIDAIIGEDGKIADLLVY